MSRMAVLMAGRPNADTVSKLPSARGLSAAGPFDGQEPLKSFHSSRLL
jgi:hypothetical protein